MAAWHNPPRRPRDAAPVAPPLLRRSNGRPADRPADRPASRNGHASSERAMSSPRPSLHPGHGTDPHTGVNPADAEHAGQTHTLRCLDAAPTPVDVSKTYRVVYDPELYKARTAKGKRRLRFQLECHERAHDPRLRLGAQYFAKPPKNLKKLPFKLLPQAQLVHDKDSLGAPPKTTLVAYDLPPLVDEKFLTVFMALFGGAVRDVRFVSDPANGVPLGIATFAFQGPLEKALRQAKALLQRVKAERPNIDGVELKVALDDDAGTVAARKMHNARELLRERRLEREKLEREREAALKRAREREEHERRLREERRQEERREREHSEPEFAPGTTTMSHKFRHKVVPCPKLGKELNRYVKDRPYIYIDDHFVPTHRVLLGDIKKVLQKYDWTRVLVERLGFYVVFHSLREATRCFRNEDGVRFFEFRMYMDLCVPERYEARHEEAVSSHDVVSEAANSLIKEFQLFLSKDIRERIIAPLVLDLLNPDRYPDLVHELQQQEQLQTQEAAREGGTEPVSFLGLPSFKRAGAKKKKVVPMQHALNYESESDEDSDMTPAKRSAEDDGAARKKTKLSDTLRFESEEEEEEEPAEKPSQYMPTRTPQPVPVHEEVHSGLYTLQHLQETIVDNEDLELARKLLANVEPRVPRHPQYWFWKQRQSLPEMGISTSLPLHLECSTGSFKSEGYRKIPEADKIEYLPHKRKVHKPLKTVQHNEEDTGASLLQSLRVNRANNRRFAADISAQKQILLTELDLLNLNALNKRKKPVSFARSAIHNWGLFALEPIAAKEMIIEYVGESIRQQVAEHRERSYLKTGIGLSYLFRIDENTVIDATKRGGIARFINHCCNPSCTAKIIKVDGKKRIVIYALRDIDTNEELTYDYKFERETNDAERIRCLCGAPGCKGYLN